MILAFIKTASGNTYAILTAETGDSLASQMITLRRSEFKVDTTTDKFILTGPALGVYKDGLAIPKAKIDKTGSSPAITSTATADMYDEIVDNFFNNASSGGGAINFTALGSDTTWDATAKYVSLSGDTTLDFDPGSRTAGQLKIKHNSHSLTLTFTDSTTRTFTLTGGSAVVILVWELADQYVWQINKDILVDDIPVVDTTAPTVSSMEATDAHTIIGTFSENMGFSTDGWHFFDATNPLSPVELTVSGATGDGTDTITFTIVEDMTGLDLSWQYVASEGNTSDMASTPNLLADDSGSVTNSISSGGGYGAEMLFNSDFTSGLAANENLGWVLPSGGSVAIGSGFVMPTTGSGSTFIRQDVAGLDTTKQYQFRVHFDPSTTTNTAVPFGYNPGWDDGYTILIGNTVVYPTYTERTFTPSGTTFPFYLNIPDGVKLILVSCREIL